MSIIKTIAAYQLVRLIATPFTKWDAYEEGLIDDKGESLKKAKSQSEKKSFTVFHRLVRRIKQIMSKAPFGAFKIASLIIALKLLKEETDVDLTHELEQFGLTNDILVEQCSHYTKNEVLCKGKYALNNDIFVVSSDLSPIDNMIGTNIYEVFEVVTKRRILVTLDCIRKI